jgi:hypothetical protein
MSPEIARARQVSADIETALEALAAQQVRIARMLRDDDAEDEVMMLASQLRAVAMMAHDVQVDLVVEAERQREPSTRERAVARTARLRVVFRGVRS